MESLDKDTIVQTIHSATQDVFTTMMGLDVKAEDSFEEANGSGTVDGVVALIGLAGQWVGGGILHCDAELARKLYSHLLMTDALPAADGVTEEVLDAIAEIANMIIGNVKNVIEQQVGTIGLGIPSVVYGRKFTTRNAGSHWIVVPFECDGAHMWVKFCLTPPSNAGPASPEILREFPRNKRLTIS
jgi:chemotaxis protein CheX